MFVLNVKETKEGFSSKFTKTIKNKQDIVSVATANLNGSVMPYLTLSHSVLISCLEKKMKTVKHTIRLSILAVKNSVTNHCLFQPLNPLH